MARTEDQIPTTGTSSDRRTPLPWWFWLLFTLAALGIAATPLIAALTSSGTATSWTLASLVVVYLLSRPVARRLRGVEVSTTAPGPTAARRYALVVVIVVLAGTGFFLANALVRSGAIAAAALVVVAITGLIVGPVVWKDRTAARSRP